MPTWVSETFAAADRLPHSVDATVRNTLGEGFELWVRCGRQWLSWPSGEPIAADCCLESVNVLQLLDATAQRLAPTSVAPAPDRQVFAVPFAQSDTLIVAVAALATDELLRHLATSLQQGLLLSRQLEDQLHLADDCARQISEDLEHVTYLQNLSEHLQLCEVSRSPSDVARSVLPLLRDLIQAEFLLLLTSEDGPGETQCDRTQANHRWFERAEETSTSTFAGILSDGFPPRRKGKS